MQAQLEIERILRENGVIVRRDHPELVAAIDWLVRKGLLRPVLNGVYTWTQRAEDFELRVAAVTARDADAVIIGSAAARLTFWNTLKDTRVDVASPRCRARQSGDIFVHRRTIPPELVMERRGVRLSSPALTAIDLAESSNGGSIDRVLLKGQATLASMHEALELTRGRRGHAARRQLLLDSRDEPWSFAEREAHRLLREAGITGWKANFALHLHGVRYFLDIAFEKQRLAIEIDGVDSHGPAELERDLWRQNDIIFDGWHIIRFAASVVIRTGQIFVAQVERALNHWA